MRVFLDRQVGIRRMIGTPVGETDVEQVHPCPGQQPPCAKTGLDGKTPWGGQGLDCGKSLGSSGSPMLARVRLDDRHPRWICGYLVSDRLNS